MSNQVLLTLSETTYQHAESLAKLTHRDVSDVLVDTIELSLPSLPANTHAVSISTLTDDAVLALTESQLNEKDDIRMSQLLYKQQAGELLYAEHHELERLMQLYREGLLRKTEALVEAVQRGIHEPLLP